MVAHDLACRNTVSVCVCVGGAPGWSARAFVKFHLMAFTSVPGALALQNMYKGSTPALENMLPFTFTCGQPRVRECAIRMPERRLSVPWRTRGK